MNDDRHKELRLLVQADCDGELAARDAAAVAAHLEGCAECRALQHDLRDAKTRLRAEAPFHRAPDDFRRRMETLLAEHATARRTPSSPWAWRRLIGPVGSFGLGAAVAAALILLVAMPRDTGVEQAVIDGHLRALQSGRLFDVASSDQHTVKPWFDGRIDFAPPVRDLAAQGFPLRGGRLDTVGGRAVAVLVYGRAKHVIDLYVWRAPDAGEALPRDAMRNGYNLVSWSRDGMMFWAVSDVNQRELDDFARDWQAAS